MKTNLKYAFHIFWIFYFFILCICSALDTDPKVQAKQSPSAGGNETNSHSLPSESKHQDHTTDTAGSIPDSKDSTLTGSKPSEGDGTNTRPESETSSEKQSEHSEKDKNVNQDSESNETSTGVHEPVILDSGKTSSSPAGAKEEVSQLSDNVKAPSGDIPPPQKDDEKKEVEAKSVEAPKTPAAGVHLKKESNKSEDSGTSSDVGGKEKVESGSVSTTGYQPEDGSDVPTFDEYQRTFTEKRDASGVEGKNGGRGEESKNGGAGAKDAIGVNEGTTAQAGKSAGSVVGRFKNVGSTSCGAKVVAHNDEASFPAHVLNENRDEYMNHPCTVKKWFVVEACEPVRLRQIDIASYELFSSMVKTFRVSASERYPQKLWDMVGTFTAKNEKGVQTYRAEQDKYYKYFKFEILDHHGNEHFCPLSLIRLYGVLMEDDDGDDYPGTEPTPEGEGVKGGGGGGIVNENIINTKDQENSQSLLGSATKALVDIVKKTLQPRKSATDDGTKSSESTTSTPVGETTTTPSPLTDSAMADAITPQEETRLSQLIKLLMSGEYSSILRRCVELLRQTPSAVQRQLILHEYIPSPTMAFAECSKAAAIARLSSKDLRWAYLIFNNASLPWEPEKRAAKFGKLMDVSSKSSEEQKLEVGVAGKDKEQGEQITISPSDHTTAGKDAKPSNEADSKLETNDARKAVVDEKEKSIPPIENVGVTSSASGQVSPDESKKDGERTSTKGADEKVVKKDAPDDVTKQYDNKSLANDTNEGVPPDEKVVTLNKGDADPVSKPDLETEKIPVDKVKLRPESKILIEKQQPPVDKEKEQPVDKQQQQGKEKEQKKEQERSQEDASKDSEKKDDKQPKTEPKNEPQKVQGSSDKGAPSDQSSKQEKPSTGKGEAKKVETPQVKKTGAPQAKKTEIPQGVPKEKAFNKENVVGSNGRNLGIKENAYMRLSNKLRAMEINITVSMAYLEELSRSYKKKTDKMSKHMEKALLKLEETAVQAEERDQVQQKRISVLEKQIEELRDELKSTVINMRKENTRVVHGIILQAVTLNVILMIFHAILTIYCSRRRRHSDEIISSRSNPRHSAPEFTPYNHFENSNGNAYPVLSNSDTNLYIVDPPFRLEEQTVKKDGKRKKKRKKALAPSHQDNLNHNGFRDRSASESRIEDLM